MQTYKVINRREKHAQPCYECDVAQFPSVSLWLCCSLLKWTVSVSIDLESFSRAAKFSTPIIFIQFWSPCKVNLASRYTSVFVQYCWTATCVSRVRGDEVRGVDFSGIKIHIFHCVFRVFSPKKCISVLSQPQCACKLSHLTCISSHCHAHFSKFIRPHAWW